MTDNEPLPLDPCYPLHFDTLNALRHQRLAHFMALRNGQSEDRDLLEYLDYRIEVTSKCVQDELRKCEVRATDDFYQP